MSVLENFDKWTDFLADKLQNAEQNGMSQETISNVAFEVGNYLSEDVDAKNDEQEVLLELWNAASEDEQRAIANTMVKLVQNKGNSN